MSAGERSGGRVVTWLVALAGVALVVCGAAAWLWSPATGGTERADDPPVVDTTSPPAGQRIVGSVPMAKRVDREPGAPQRLRVPALGIDAPVIPVAAPGGVLTPPSDPQVLGWWADGARPGAEEGSALITGHTVHTGGGAMDDLEQLTPGDRVWLRTDHGRIGYQVSKVTVLGKGELAQRAESLFDQSVPGRLVLITCEDWNGVEYLSNAVVTATPVA